MTTEALGGAVPEWTRGDRLRKARSCSGLSVQQFHDKTGIGTKTINNYEGDKVEPRRPTLIVWALFTGISLEWLEHGTGEFTPGPNPPGLPVEVQPEPANDLARLTAEKHARTRSGGQGGTTRRFPVAA